MNLALVKPRDITNSLWELKSADHVLTFVQTDDALPEADLRLHPRPNGRNIEVRTGRIVAYVPHEGKEKEFENKWFARFLRPDTVLVCTLAEYAFGRSVIFRSWAFREELGRWRWIHPLDPEFVDIQESYEAYVTMAES